MSMDTYQKAKEYKPLLKTYKETKAEHARTRDIDDAFIAAHALTALNEWEENNRELIALALEAYES